ncbi:MAG: C69 family dipeptidase [Leptospiraceae bacterium]|nr:C69 family dipeptidase [Leptospiraceae bacterium]
MCDTMVATPDVTASGHMLFGKNSDREPNEAQALVRYPRMEHSEKEVRVTFINVPQVKTTNEVILSRPFHMWGAEMGVNEHGVVIGNEAVFTRIPFARKNTGLTGMDMIRLALERTSGAQAALELITGLIEQYSQDACGGYTDRKLFYHNSFIIADAREAYVLETAGEQWAAVRVRGFRSISNGLTITNEYDFASKDLVEYAHRKGWLKRGDDFSFRDAYSDRFYTYFSKCRPRQTYSMQAGLDAQGRLNPAAIMSILRSHAPGHASEKFQPADSGMDSLCMHATGLTTPSQTAGSLVAEIRPDSHASTYWFTGSAAPCISVFKPCFCPGQNLESGDYTEPGPYPDHSLWWQSEQLHRLVLKDYARATAVFLRERDALESDFFEQERIYVGRNASRSELNSFSEECFQKANEALERWTESVRQMKLQPGRFAPLYRMFRKRVDKAARIEA